MFEVVRPRRSAAQQFYPADDRVERRAELVRKRREEKIFLLIGLVELSEQVACLILPLACTKSAPNRAIRIVILMGRSTIVALSLLLSVCSEALGVLGTARKYNDRNIRPDRLSLAEG